MIRQLSKLQEQLELNPSTSPIKSIFEESGHIIRKTDGSEIEDMQDIRLLEFNKQGFVLRETDSYGYESFTMNNSQIIEYKRFDSDEKVFQSCSSVDGQAQEVLNENLYNNNQLLLQQIIQYHYDAAGNLIEELDHDEVSGCEDKTVIEYNDSGTKIEERNYVDGQLWKLNEFDNNGNRIKLVVYNEEGTEKAQNISSFDAQNRIILDCHYEDGVLQRRIDHRYPTKEIYENEIYHVETKRTFKNVVIGNRTTGLQRDKQFLNGRLLNETFQRFNDKGWLIEDEHQGIPFGENMTAQFFDIDHHGNWRTRIQTVKPFGDKEFHCDPKSHDGLVYRIARRNIEYFT